MRKSQLKIPQSSQRSKLGMGFDKLFGTQYGDIAGLKPLPVARMFRQAGRPVHRQTKPGTAHALTIKRNQLFSNIIQNWNPLQVENKQRLNNTNPNKRSKLAIPESSTSITTLQNLRNKLQERARIAQNRSLPADYGEGNPETFRAKSRTEALYRKNSDLSEYLSPNEREIAKASLFDLFRKKKGQVTEDDVPFSIKSQMPRFSEETVYAYNNMLRSNLVDMLDLTRETIKPIDTISNPNPRGAGLGGV